MSLRKGVTNIDWSKHIVETTIFDQGRIDWIRIPGTVNRNVKFINVGGVLTVTGDYGNWVFCREFHPSPDGYVSRGYWDEKLEIGSVQKADKFDTDATLEEIKTFEEELFNEVGEDIFVENYQDWIEELKSTVYDKIDYIQVAYRDNPMGIDYERIPFGEVRHRRLDCVYDAFNEICQRMEIERASHPKGPEECIQLTDIKKQ